MSQYEDRRTEYFLDQWDRTWESVVDKTGVPCSGLQPFGWTAPMANPEYLWIKGLFVPPGNLVRPERRERGQQQRVKVQMFEWMAQQEQNHMLKDQERTRIAKLMAPETYMELLQNPTEGFLQQVGPSPFPPLEVLQAMEDGDDWALGKTPEVPAWAVDLLQDMLYSANAMQLLPAHVKREILAAQRRRRIAKIGNTVLPSAPVADAVKRKEDKKKPLQLTAP